MHHLWKHKDLLRMFTKLNALQRKGVLNGANKSLVDCVCEMCLNLLNGNIAVNSKTKSKLGQYKDVLRTLSNKKVPYVKRKRLLVQTGNGFLPFLIPPVLSLISSLAGKAIGKRI